MKALPDRVYDRDGDPWKRLSARSKKYVLDLPGHGIIVDTLYLLDGNYGPLMLEPPPPAIDPLDYEQGW